MKVKELIKELEKFDGELEVITEGCDCYGDSASVGLDTNFDGKSVVMIWRS